MYPGNTRQRRFDRIGICGCVALSGCGLIDGVFPESANDRGTQAVHAYSALSAWGTRALPTGVTDLRFEIRDALIQPSGQEDWYLLINQPELWTLSQPDAISFAPALLPTGSYQAVRLVLDDAEIEFEGEWQRLQLSAQEVVVEIEVELDLQSIFSFELQLDDALVQDDENRWQLTPVFEVSDTPI